MIQDPAAVIRSDSVAAVRDAARALADSMQIEFLQRVNQQLGLWSNPYGVIVGALAVLFTLGGILAAYLLWRQGRDYREILETEVGKYRALLDGLLEEMRAKTKAAIEEASSELKKATGDDRKMIEGRLKSLEAERNRLEFAPLWYGAKADDKSSALARAIMDRLGSPSRITSAGFFDGYLSCPACGTIWHQLGPPATPDRPAHCPRCGASVPAVPGDPQPTE